MVDWDGTEREFKTLRRLFMDGTFYKKRKDGVHLFTLTAPPSEDLRLRRRRRTPLLYNTVQNIPPEVTSMGLLSFSRSHFIHSSFSCSECIFIFTPVLDKPFTGRTLDATLCSFEPPPHYSHRGIVNVWVRMCVCVCGLFLQWLQRKKNQQPVKSS